MFNQKVNPIVVIDVSSVVSKGDVKKLEDAGYVVIFVHGEPNQVVSIFKG